MKQHSTLIFSNHPPPPPPSPPPPRPRPPPRKLYASCNHQDICTLHPPHRHLCSPASSSLPSSSSPSALSEVACSARHTCNIRQAVSRGPSHWPNVPSMSSATSSWQWPSSAVSTPHFHPKSRVFTLLSVILLQVLLLASVPSVDSSWDQWWTYDGISGVEFWGLLNPKWSHCNKGRRQSPVDVNPDVLLYDPGLTAIAINGDQITGQLVNTGRSLVFKLTPGAFSSGASSSSTSGTSSSSASTSSSSSSSHHHVHNSFDLASSSLASLTSPSNHANSGVHASKGGLANSSVIISGGPLSYEYALNNILFHYGRSDDRGSEHTIDSIAFPAEVQLYFYNSQLYSSWDEAVDQPNGLAAIALLVQLTSNSPASLAPLTSSGNSSSSASLHFTNRQEQIHGNSQLKHLFHLLDSVKYKGSNSKVHKLSLSQLLPNLAQYLTYEGSLTQPSCVETVQWIIANKPIYITPGDLITIRNNIILEGYGEGNFRPTQPINARSLRTNIAHASNKYSNGHTFHHSSSGGDNGQSSKSNVVTDAGSDEMNLGDPDTGLNNLGTSKAKPGKNKVCSGQVTFTYRANVAANGKSSVSSAFPSDGLLYN